jgi:hypothetical protein
MEAQVTMNRLTRARPRRARGQVLVLACVTFLTMALMMLASFGVANAIHERIRIQAAADAQAFSTATLEARAFNTMAYMNRAIVGALVSEMSLHAWKAIAERDEAMMRAGFFSFLMVAAVEFSKCPKFKLHHCWHGVQALRIAFRFNSRASQVGNLIQSKENQFRTAVTSLNDAIKDTHEAQRQLLRNVKDQIMLPQSPLSPMRSMLSTSAPRASYAVLGDYNTSDFACAIEGSEFDNDCKQRSWKSNGAVAEPSKRRAIIESAAMAARGPLESGSWGPPHFGRKLAGDGYRGDGFIYNPVVRNPDAAMNVQGSGSFTEIGFMPIEAEVSNNQVSADVGFGLVYVSWRDGSGMWFTNGRASSGNPYRGVPCNGADCFINFRFINQGDETDYGQPATYGAVRQDLKRMRVERLGGGWDSTRPWEQKGQGTVSVQLTQDRAARLTTVPRDQGVAVAKGKTYFHQLDSWQVPPNMFDPFWRAKLHPFHRDELKELLMIVGDVDGRMIMESGNSAVEGVMR